MGAVIGTQAARTGAATLVQATPTVNLQGTSLSILQWQHFVPAYDEWFPTFLNEWATANGVTATLDQINTADIPAAFAAEVSAQQGHDIVEHIASLAQFEESLVDLKDVWDEATARHGEPVPNCINNAYNPTTGKYYAFVHGYAPDPANYRKSLWESVDKPNGPTTYDELLEGGTRIWNEQGVQLGLGMSQEIDSQMAALTMIWAHGGSIQDENENVVINSPETIAAVEFMKKLQQPVARGRRRVVHPELDLRVPLGADELARCRERCLLQHAAARPGRGGAGQGARARGLRLPAAKLFAEPGHRQGIHAAPDSELRRGGRGRAALQLPDLPLHRAGIAGRGWDARCRPVRRRAA
jgi:hypothetical protein